MPEPSPRRLLAAACLTALLAIGAAGSSGASVLGLGGGSAPNCPVAPSAAALPSVSTLHNQNAFLAALGSRPTGSPQQDTYITWIRHQLARVPGISVSESWFRIHRWSERSASLILRVGRHKRRLPIAAAIPYSKPTGRRGVSGPLVAIPDDQAITAQNAAGRVVVRPAPAGSVPYADFLLPVVSWASYDPGHTIDPTGTFYGDFINYNQRVADLRAASQAGARAIIFVKDLPRGQLAGHYEPYEGSSWGLPGVWLGADQGQRLRAALASGRRASARLVLHAGYRNVRTPSVFATVPGASPQRIVIDSHTDGTNAVEDNGPIAMVAMARYLAGLAPACRPRTIEFSFSTAHFYQRVASPDQRYGGAGQFAAQLDRDYDAGTVSSVLTIEHLGAIDYEGAPRPGRPGEKLVATGQPAIQFIAITPSPSLVSAVLGVVQRYDMRRTILLQGADAPGTTVPSHCNFGGEGTPFNVHLLPTIGEIAAPQTLYDPAFGLAGIDFNLMHSELLGYTELVNRLGTLSQAEVAGSIPVERLQRAEGGKPCPPEN